MSKKNLFTLYFVLIFVFAYYFVIAVNNSIVAVKEDALLYQSQIEVELARKNDLIPNLVSTVKEYANHEEEVFTRITDTRTKLLKSLDSGNLNEAFSLNQDLDVQIDTLLQASYEAYPELKSDTLFIGLLDELAGTENRISIARRNFNEKVAEYNVKVSSFPNNIIAFIFKHKPMQYFSTDITNNLNISFD